METINKYSTVPIYVQLMDIINSRIQNGAYVPDSKIPSEQEFCDAFNISRPTVRQAISELVKAGVLYIQKGKGTFVSRLKSIIDIKNYTGFTDSILDSSIPGDKEIVICVEVGDNQLLPEILSQTGKSYAKTVWILKHENRTVALVTSYIAIQLFPEIINDIRAKKSSYEIMRGKYPLIPVKSKSTLECITAGIDDTAILGVQKGTVLIEIKNTLFSKSGQEVEYIISRYRPDYCRITFENSSSR